MSVNTIDLFEEVKNNNRTAYEMLFRQFYAPLVRFAKEILKDKDRAEDMVQEVFVKVWEKRHQINIETGIKPYLYMAVKNHCLSALRVEERNVFLADELGDDIRVSSNQADLQTNTIHLKQHIAEAIEKLPPKCALIFKMSRFEEKTYQEIADALELSVKTIENQMGRALQLLRTHLHPYLNAIIFIISLKFFS
ncbi:MAG: RNA polymerase sigma-70 factor [Bacteroidetes bacterium]|nr:MAG: RNA polymerase sigma-70 factor [Bacteroidota bacterium]